MKDFLGERKSRLNSAENIYCFLLEGLRGNIIIIELVTQKCSLVAKDIVKYCITFVALKREREIERNRSKQNGMLVTYR